MSPEVIISHHEETVIETVSESRFIKFLDAAGDFVLLALVFLLPLFFLPGLQDGVELPKQLLLLAIITLAGVIWLLRVFLSRSLTLRRTFLFFPIILYVVGLGIATLLSIDRYTSLFGGSLGEYSSFATLVGFFLFLFFAASSKHDLKFIRRSVLVFFVATTVLLLVSFIKLFGVVIPGLPATSTWNPVGSVFALGLFSAGTLLLASGILLFDSKQHPDFASGRGSVVLRVLASISGVLSLAFLLVLDWWIAWVVVLAGTGLLLAFVFVYAHAFKNLVRLLLPLLAFVLGILFLFVRTPIGVNLPVEISPSAKASFEIAQNVLREHPAFGSGPATYSLEYAKYRPDTMNATPLWNLYFGRGSSLALTILPTTGLVGAILWLLFLVVMIGFAVRSFLKEKDSTAWLLTTVLFFPWIGALVGCFLYGSSMTLEFFFWFLTTLLVVAMSRRLSAFTFSGTPRALLGASLGAVVFAVFMVILLLLGFSRYLAWASFGQAVQANAAGDLPGTREALVRASSYDPRTDVFMRNLAQSRLLEASKSESTEDLRTLLNAAVGASLQATTISPKNVQNWSMLGSIYQEMSGVVGGAGQLGIDAYLKARELEPQNPIYPTQIARLKMLLADQAKQRADSKDATISQAAKAEVDERLSEAGHLLEEAIALKQDYAPAHFYLSFVLVRQGKLTDAIGKMESVLKYNPRDVGALFQLGLLYIENKEVAKAETAFGRALQLSPNYANAHWYLASIYESRGDFPKAITEIEAVLATNPDNEAVKQRLEALRAGQTTKGLPEPVSPNQETSGKFPR